MRSIGIRSITESRANARNVLQLFIGRVIWSQKVAASQLRYCSLEMLIPRYHDCVFGETLQLSRLLLLGLDDYSYWRPWPAEA